MKVLFQVSDPSFNDGTMREGGYSNPASSYKRAMPTKQIKKEKKKFQISMIKQAFSLRELWLLQKI